MKKPGQGVPSYTFKKNVRTTFPIAGSCGLSAGKTQVSKITGLPVGWLIHQSHIPYASAAASPVLHFTPSANRI